MKVLEKYINHLKRNKHKVSVSKKPKYTLSQKLSYYMQRQFDNTLTKKQKDYAKRRYDELNKQFKKEYPHLGGGY